MLHDNKMEVWINDVLVDEIAAFQAKIEFDKEDIDICGEMMTQHKITGYSLSLIHILYKMLYLKKKKN